MDTTNYCVIRISIIREMRYFFQTLSTGGEQDLSPEDVAIGGCIEEMKLLRNTPSGFAPSMSSIVQPKAPLML